MPRDALACLSNIVESCDAVGWPLVAALAARMYAGRLTMPFSNPMLPLFLAIGTLFGALAAACAYVISYAEYRQRMLRLDQNPRRMALETAAVTFAFFLVAAVVLSFLLGPAGS
jgi:hypothetical protein